ncbi:MAG: DAK2 domain-containing protein [Candidatus Heimdallarchaeota archaeon]|nr:DAK2 domain-containing protein [Candidatus Heimdallarchaeota archaeon]
MSEDDFTLMDYKIYPEVILPSELVFMLQNSLKKLEQYRSLLNSINVFPVPDGDTGTNLVQTFRSIIHELSNVGIKNNCGEIISFASQGAFTNCAGSSGSILSEYFRGLEIAWKDQKTLSNHDLVTGLKKGAEFAYKAVVRPREGTILTVARQIGESAAILEETVTTPFELLLLIFEDAKVALKNTRNILKEAKKAGVVDAGAMGLVIMFEGFLETLKDIYAAKISITPVSEDISDYLNPELPTDEIQKEYEVIIQITALKYPISVLIAELHQLGKALVINKTNQEAVIKVHIHCKDPKEVIKKIGHLAESVIIISIQSIHEQAMEFMRISNQDIGETPG